MKILITGGHLTPALSLVQYLGEKGDQTLYVGRKYANKAEEIISREEEEIASTKAEFSSINAFKIHRHNLFKSILEIPKIITSFSKSFKLINQYKPDVMVSFGGYLAVPIAIVAKIKKIPILTHEQTVVTGLSNKLLGSFADKVAYSWERNSSSSKYIFTGNLIRKEMILQSIKPSWISSDFPIIYITGGSQGSKKINDVVRKILPQVIGKYTVVHQCGGNKENHYIEKFSQLKQNLSDKMQSRYFVKTWYNAEQVSWLLENAAVVISRSGANTISEIIAKSSPSILIPLPYAAANEQFLNAKMVSDQKAAVLLEQSQLSPESLLNSIEKVIQNKASMKENLVKIKESLPKNPQEKIYQIILSLYEKTKR